MPRVSNRRQRNQQQETPTNSASPSNTVAKKAPKKSRKAVTKATKSNEAKYLKIQEQAKHCDRVETLRSILKDAEKDEWKYKPVDVLLGLTDRNK